MHLPDSHRIAALWIAFVAVLVGSLGGAHLHLCFDGQEPPASVHVSEQIGHDDGHHELDGHVDQDVELFDASIVAHKADADDAIQPVVVGVFQFIAASLTAFRVGFTRDALLPLLSRFHWRPPLRGPPL